MRLITWNCQGSFARKYDVVEALRPDVLIVQECEPMKGLSQSLGAKPLRSMHWVGDIKHKGLGIFTFGDYELAEKPEAEPRHRWIVPLRVNGPLSLVVMAVWTVPHPQSGSYVQPLQEALTHNHTLHADGDVVWVGDFNAGVRFDKHSTRYKFTDFITAMNAQGVHSLYHRKTGETHGLESASTFFMHRNPSKGYHIDYIFAGRHVMERSHSLVIGEPAEWLKLADHLPLILDIDDPTSINDLCKKAPFTVKAHGVFS